MGCRRNDIAGRYPARGRYPSGTGAASLVLPGLVTGNSSGNSGVSAEFSQGASQPSDFAVSRSAYIVNHTGGTAGGVAANSRIDTLIYNSPYNDIWGGLDRLLWSGQSTGSTPAEHVARYIQTVRQAGTAGVAQPQMWGAAIEYRDTTDQPSSVTGSGITCEMDWFGNGLDNNTTIQARQIQSLVIGQSDTLGSPLEISNVIGVWTNGTTAHAKTVFSVNIPFSNAVLDTSSATQKSGAAAIKLAAGHQIAFEPTVTYRLGYDSTTNVLRWYQGTVSFIVGRGISVGFQSIATSSFCAGVDAGVKLPRTAV